MPEISLKTSEEISLMVEGGEKLGRILEEVLKKIRPGLFTLEIDSWIEEKIVKAGGIPSFKLVPRYHWASCVGLNEEVVHSIPKKDKIVKENDLLKIDLGMFWKGFHTDLAWTILVQSSPKEFLQNSTGQAKFKVQSYLKKFLGVGEKALTEAISVARPGNRLGHISRAIQEVIEEGGCVPVRILTGHGIGRELHEAPLIPGFLKGKPENTPELLPGMTLAIEVIYSQKSPEVVLEDDGWTIFTKDGKMSGLFEKTIAITKTKTLILTPITYVFGV